MKSKTIATLVLFLCFGSNILLAEQSPLQQFGDFIGEKMGLQPKTFNSRYGEIKIKWNSNGFDVQLFFTILPPSLIAHYQGELSYGADFTLNVLDKDGFEILDDSMARDCYFSNVTFTESNGKLTGATYRGRVYCNMEQYRKIVTIEPVFK